MKPSRIASLLVLLNLALLGGVFYLIKAVGEKPPPPAPRVIVKEAAPVVVKEKEIVTVTTTNEFRWAQLESEDYPTYIERLRSIGCPEETIRDIIISDVEKLMTPRLQALNPQRKNLKYWQSEEKELDDPLAYQEAAGQQMEIDFEKRDIIQQLVGVDLVAERMKAQGQEDFVGQRLAFLPEEKRSEFRKIMERFNHAEVVMREKFWADGDSLSPEDEAQLRQLQQQRESAITALLSPAEQRQYELSLSPTSYKVRDAMFGMTPSEVEYLAVFQLQKEFDTKWGTQDIADESVRESYEKALENFQASLRQSLGDFRYHEYERAQDPDFRQLTISAVRNQVPRERAEEVYEIKRVAVMSRRQLEADPTLNDEQKRSICEEVAQETQRTVRGIIGEKAFQHYLRNSEASWLKP